MRTGLLWKIPPDVAIILSTPPFYKQCSNGSLSQKDFDMKESRELLLKSLIPILLQTSLFLYYMLHNLVSQELFGEASKRRSKKQKKKKEIEQEKLEGKSLMISFTLSIFLMVNEDRMEDETWRSPPTFHFTQIKIH